MNARRSSTTPPHRKASITDVAKKAGVSTATVSRVFSHPDKVSPATRGKVLDASHALNFSISRTAGILKSGRSFRIALLAGSTKMEWYTGEVVEGLLSVFAPAGYDLTMVPITSPAQRKQFFDRLPLRNNVDAVIVSSFRVNPGEVRQLRTMNVPIVGINVSSANGFSATNSIDDEKGIRLIVRHLTTLGHRNLLYVYQNFHSELSYSSMRRIRGFNKICAQIPGVTQRMLDVGNDDDCSGKVLDYLMGADDPPTAVCFHQDSLAVPFFISLARQGIRVPEDLSVTGFDDSTFAAQAGLTTVHQDPCAQAVLAAHTTLDLITGKTVEKHSIEAPASLVIRTSTGRPRESRYFTA